MPVPGGARPVTPAALIIIPEDVVVTIPEDVVVTPAIIISAGIIDTSADIIVIPAKAGIQAPVILAHHPRPTDVRMGGPCAGERIGFEHGNH